MAELRGIRHVLAILLDDGLQVADLLHQLLGVRLELLQLHILQQECSVELDIVGVRLIVEVGGAKQPLDLLVGHLLFARACASPCGLRLRSQVPALS